MEDYKVIVKYIYLVKADSHEEAIQKSKEKDRANQVTTSVEKISGNKEDAS